MGCNPHHGDENSSKDSSTSKLWYVGVILSIVGSVCTNVGVNLQKYSFMCEAKRCVKSKRSYARQPLWVIGLLLVIGGSGLDFVALGFLPQSLATPVGGSTMVANAIFASVFLKEKFGRMDALGTGLVLSGICIVAAFANKESDCYTIAQLVKLYSEPPFVAYVVLMTLCCIGLFTLVKRLERIRKHHGTSSMKYKRFARIHPVAYPALSGIFGAQSVLFAKSVAELIKTTAEGTNQFAKFGTYAISGSMFACIFLQIHWLAHGLQSFDAVFVVPVFQCFFISVSIFGGGVYFKEFANMTTLALSMFFFGVCVTLSGVYILAQRVHHTLTPKARFRAAINMIIFIKRTQKAKNIEHRWIVPKCIENGPPVSSVALKGPPGKLSKASVVPIDGRYPPPPRRSPFGEDEETVATEDTFIDASQSQIQITTKRFDK
ncbi:hypothetical protein Poli38472_001593 [Pythium oligandrum]|uniref:Magnesium transporter n=1 Tax=Pythium oligandrum TaxID=41045 RepID=A0A8K1FRX2_PYTOL|nr:hypothetical protein Poli38472_001593 [Pythium oligandrum]|eukprot:TMW69437.1 hypothetical protein Poli38472_001593 [Pythium oligandrum]